MKINRKLIAAFAMLSVVFGACTTTAPDVDCGVKSDLTAPGNVVWEESESDKTSLALTWDASAAIAAGATSFSAQVVKPNMETMGEGELHDFIVPDQYDSNTTVVLPVTSNYVGSANANPEDKACDQYVFKNLSNGKQYMLRVRANYPMSNYSEWVWVTDEAGELAHIKVGKGVVDPTELDDKMPPVVKISYKTASEAYVTWSVTDWKNFAADFACAWKVILKKGNDLVVSWNIPANSGIWTSDSFNGCTFVLSALDPETEYNVTVQNVTEGTEPLEPTKFTTEASKVVTMPTSAANPGDVILYEDFSEIFITSDLSRGASNYSYDKRNEMPEAWIATGEDPVANDPCGGGCYLVAPSTEVGMFNTIKKYIAVTRFNTWGMMAEDDTKGAICARVGHVKMGASSKCAWLVMPEINCLQQTATVELSFDSCVYDNYPEDASKGLDPGNIIVEVLTGCTQLSNAENSFVRPTDRMTVKTIKLTDAWTRYTVTIDNVNNGARLAIGGHRDGVDGQHRFYLDNIEIKVVSYGDLKLAAPKNVVVTPTDSTAEVVWDKVNSAEQYVVEYTNICDACGQPVWTALPATSELKAVIEGLNFETEYQVRVKAIAGDVQSEFCEPVSFKTLAEIKKLKAPKDVVISAGLSWAVFDFPAVTKATTYEVYVKDATTPLESVVKVDDATKTVNIAVAGLELNSKYSFQLKALAPGSDMEASDLSEASAEITTGSFEQIKVNEGPTVATVGWNGCEKYFDFTLEVSDASGNVMGAINLLNGKTQFGGGSSVYWNKEYPVPCRFTIGALAASTTYKVRVKPLDAADSFYSPYFEITTAAAHTAVANEVLFQSFDEMWYGGDYINCAAGLYPGDISVLPEPTWAGYIANAAYVLSLSTNTNVSASKLPKLMTSAEGYTLSGWSIANTDCRPSHCKLGGGSAPGTVITAELGAAVLNADAATKCTITMNVSPMSDGTASAAEAQVIIVHADGTETALDPVSVFATAEQSPWDFVWKKVEIKDVELKSTDKLKFTSVATGTNACRYLLDEILVVAQ